MVSRLHQERPHRFRPEPHAPDEERNRKLSSAKASFFEAPGCLSDSSRVLHHISLMPA